MSWLSEFCYEVYDNLEESLAAGAHWVGEKANACYELACDGIEAAGEVIGGSVAWIYESLQGDWNDD